MFFDFVQPQQAYYQVPQGRQQLRRRPGPHLAKVLAEYHIPHPVQPVFYPPVAAPDLQQPGSIRPLQRDYSKSALSKLP